MKTTFVQYIIPLERHDVVKGILYMKLLQKGIRLVNNDLNTLCLFSETDDVEEVIRVALEKKYIGSLRSGENLVSRLTFKLGLLKKMGRRKRVIDPELLSVDGAEQIAATLKVYNP